MTPSTSARTEEKGYQFQASYSEPVERVNLVKQDACWYLRTRIEGTAVEWLVDSGANPNLLSSKVYFSIPEDQRPPLRPLETKLFAANEQGIQTHGQTCIDFCLSDGTIFHESVIVADIGDTQGILGMRFLRNQDAFVQFKKGVLWCGDLCWNLIGPESSNGMQARLTKGVIVPAGHGLTVPVHFDAQRAETFRRDPEGWDAILEAPEDLVSLNGVAVPRAVVRVRKVNGMWGTYVSLTNFSQEDVIMLPGSCVGSVLPAGDVTPSEGLRCSRVSNVEGRTLPEHLQPLLAKGTKHLSKPQRDAVEKLLCQYQDTFVGPDGQLGTTNLVEHGIDTGEAAPIKSAYRPPGFAKKQVIEENLQKMLQLDVIEASESAWSSPVVLVKKRDGTFRFCIDLRRVNEVTKKDAYPLPNIQDCLTSLAGSEWFCTLDLASGYWQVGMKVEDREKTAFSTHKGLYHFKKMPFGLTNAPATFMRLMELALRGLEWEHCLVYLDDVIVFGSSFEKCLANLELVLERFHSAGLRLKPSKCDLFQPEVAFLGHRVNKDGISCDPAKLAAVRDWPRPDKLAEVRSFLGLATYYKKFLPNFSELVQPLTDLTRKGVRFHWSEECEASFTQLKEQLTSAPILAYPSENPEDTFILDTDASDKGMGAVLSQVRQGTEHVISYASKSLLPSQRRYCATYRELLAVVEFVPYFKHFLLGRDFIIRTDHSSLKWLHRFKEADGLVGRWLAILANYTYTIQHRDGKSHGNADALSRHPTVYRRRCGRDECQDCAGKKGTPIQGCFHLVNESREEVFCAGLPECSLPAESSEQVEPLLSPFNGCNWLNPVSHEELQQMQESDADLKQVLQWVTAGVKPDKKILAPCSRVVKNMIHLWPSLQVKNGVLYRCWSRRKRGDIFQLVAPVELRQEIFRQLHCVRHGGHFGVRRTLSAMRNRFYWPNLKEDVRRWCAECEACASAKHSPRCNAKLQQEPVGYRLERVAIDLMGELPTTDSGKKYVLVVSDYFTKWTQAFSLSDCTALTVADVLVNEFFSLFGLPAWLHSDMGSNFESELFQELCRLLDIRKTRTVSYHPQSDGLVERFNRTCKQMLKIFVNENRADWDEHLPLLMMAYRSSPHASTGMSPNLMMFGDELIAPIDLMVEAPPRHQNHYRCRTEYVEWLRQTLVKSHTFARDQLGIAAQQQKEYYDRKVKASEFLLNSFVWYWSPPRANRKFGKGWTGPYKVIERPTEAHCLLKLTPSSKPKLTHNNQLKPHLGRIPACWEVDVPHPVVDEESIEASSESGDSGEEEQFSPGSQGLPSEAIGLSPVVSSPLVVSLPSLLPSSPVVTAPLVVSLPALSPSPIPSIVVSPQIRQESDSSMSRRGANMHSGSGTPGPVIVHRGPEYTSPLPQPCLPSPRRGTRVRKPCIKLDL